MSKNSVYYELMVMSTNNIENPRYTDIETFFERVESAKKNLKKAYDYIVKNYKTLDQNRIKNIYEMFIEE